jgi:hypothetical protein
VVVPLDAITTVEAVPDVLSYRRGLRMPGTGIPGSVMIGTWRGTDASGHKYKDFAVVHRSGPGVVVHAVGADYDRLLIESDDAETLAGRIRAGG